jgi:hypothetical protein
LAANEQTLTVNFDLLVHLNNLLHRLSANAKLLLVVRVHAEITANWARNKSDNGSTGQTQRRGITNCTDWKFGLNKFSIHYKISTSS